MITHAGRTLLLALIVLFAVWRPAAGAEAPWQDAEALRTESAQIQRRLFRTPDATLREDVAKRLDRVRHLWNGRLESAYGRAAPVQARQTDEAVAAFAEAVGRWDPASAAASRARIWTGLVDGAFRAALTRLDEGQAEEAAGWLNIREYARTSRDTAASIAMREVLAGRLETEQARSVVETELLGIYAGELRRAVAEARSHLGTCSCRKTLRFGSAQNRQGRWQRPSPG